MSQIIHIRTIAQIHKSLGLPPPMHPLISLISIDESVTSYDYGDFTYVYDFYQIALKSGIQGDIAYGRNHYDYDQGSMVFTKPSQAQQYSNIESVETERGWVLLFHPDLIRRSGLAGQMESYSFFSYDTNEALHVSEREKQILSELVAQIKEEYSQNIDKHTQRLIVSNIELILNYCTRFYERQFIIRQNHNLDLMEKVDGILREYFESDSAVERGLPTVKYLSEAMCMSSNYLSDMIKNATGRTAQQYIQDHVIDRIKNALLGTNEQVSQIAYSLGFEYPQHLSKLFKAKTGMTPVEYRKSMN